MEEIVIAMRLQELETCKRLWRAICDVQRFSSEKAILWTEHMYFVDKKIFEVKILNDSIISVKEISKADGLTFFILHPRNLCQLNKLH